VSAEPETGAIGQVEKRSLELTAEERAALAKRRFSAQDRAVVAHLLGPFERTLRNHVLEEWRSASPRYVKWSCEVANHFLARMMVSLGRTYWAFDWDSLLSWRRAVLAQNAERSRDWHQRWAKWWRRVTQSLFFLGAIPYHEAMCPSSNRRLAQRWIGRREALELEARFLATAKRIGYWNERQLKKTVVGALFGAMLFAGKKDATTLKKEDLESWQAWTDRSERVARESITCIQRVLAAMGHLENEPPRRSGRAPNPRFNWGRTALRIAETFERFLSDMSTVREPSTVRNYRCTLRRFGDWLGEEFPDVRSVAEVRRVHIEAFKAAVAEMRCGDHTVPADDDGPPTYRFGEPLSQKTRHGTLRNLRVFFLHVEVLEYPERPGRPLWIRGDLGQVDEEMPRTIPEGDWRRLTDLAERLTPELAEEHGFPGPFQRTRAIFAVLFECALRAGELCRLDTGCLLAALDEQTGRQTHWLRVPVGKCRNDRMVPVRPRLVEAVDAWMRVRGPQPPGWDERANKARDFLFSWQGRNLTTNALNALIERLCSCAETKDLYTSHRFRHTLAVLWRKRGMKLETISRMLGHKDLRMTLRYAAVMPPELRKEFEEAFAAIDEEHRATAQIRVLLSPEAHVAAQREWRESMFVDLGIGWCGLTAYHPCETRLACHTCPNFLPDKKRLPLLEHQRRNLIELRGLTERVPATRRTDLEQELDSAIGGLDGNIAAVADDAEEAEE
jgi:integrase